MACERDSLTEFSRTERTDNAIHEEGAVVLAGVLGQLPQLKILSLSGTSSLGVLRRPNLAKPKRRMSCIMRLSMCCVLRSCAGNAIGNDGATALAAVLAQTRLTHLDLLGA